MAVTWLFPLLWAVFTALRPYGDTAADGYVSSPTTSTSTTSSTPWTQGEFPRFYFNTS